MPSPCGRTRSRPISPSRSWLPAAIAGCVPAAPGAHRLTCACRPPPGMRAPRPSGRCWPSSPPIGGWRRWSAACPSPSSPACSPSPSCAACRWLDRRTFEEAAPSGSALGATASAALAALALGLTFALDKGMLTVAFALTALGTAWVAERIAMPALRYAVGAIGLHRPGAADLEPDHRGRRSRPDPDQLASLGLRRSGRGLSRRRAACWSGPAATGSSS